VSIFSAAPRCYWPESPTGDPPPAIVYDTLPVAVLKYGSNSSTSTREAMARFKLVIVSYDFKTYSTATFESQLADIRARAAASWDNAGIKIITYVNVGEALMVQTGSDGTYEYPGQKAASEDWWLREVDGTLTRTYEGRVGNGYTAEDRGTWVTGVSYAYNDLVVSGSTKYRCLTAHTSNTFSTDLAAGRWTTSLGSFNINSTAYVTDDSGGRNYAEWYADACEHFRGDADGYFLDNFHYFPTSTAEWLMDGINRASTSTEVKTAVRQAFRTFLDRVASLDATKFVIGNGQQLGGVLSTAVEFHQSTELNGQIDGIFGEFLMGDSADYMLAEGGWSKVKQFMDLYVAASGGGYALMQAKTATNTDYRNMRFALCTALLCGSWFCINTPGNSGVPTWFDEFSADLGDPDGAATNVSGNIWTRKYQNGIVVLNAAQTGPFGVDPIYRPGSAQTYTPPSGIYKYVTATQDTTANVQSGGSGATITGSISIAGWDGRVLQCVTPGVHT
jgi:hypothetical protein